MDATKLLKHMSWANQQILGSVSKLPDTALDAYSVNPEWQVREILRHITSSASWYGFRLLKASGATEAELSAIHEKLETLNNAPKNAEDIPFFLDALLAADRILLEQSHLPEGEVRREFEGKTIVRSRSTVLSQAIHHATEHRAQLVDALEYGVTRPSI